MDFARTRSGVAQCLACWAHNPKVRGSKPRSATTALGAGRWGVPALAARGLKTWIGDSGTQARGVRAQTQRSGAVASVLGP